MFSQSISINHNHLQLSGMLHLPNRKQNEKVPLIVLLHGFIGSKVGEHRLFVKAARYFTEKGFGLFRFDFSGCGESDGDYGDVTVTKQLDEVQTVLNYVSKLKAVDEQNIILIGHSLGGAVAALTASRDQRIGKLILWSAVGTPYEDITGILGNRAVSIAKGSGKVDYQGFYVSKTFLEDLKSHHPLQAIRSYDGETLVIHAKEDEDIPKEHTASYLKSLQQRILSKEVCSYYIENADHTFSSYQFEDELFAQSAGWLEKWYRQPNLRTAL